MPRKAVHPANQAFRALLDTTLNPDNFRFVASLADGTKITKAQFDQVNRYGVTTLNDGRVIDRHEMLFCC